MRFYDEVLRRPAYSRPTRWSRAGLGTLSVASAIGIYLLIVFGAVVRVTGLWTGLPGLASCATVS